ncbi:MAG: class I SAM-dependent RNA methyltransferase [Candidatus Dormibacteraeota bacterium]|nr:class I SAM-dependent RNA methyltransferase [Candidatus Dormibacteraeota bacterium]
MVHGGLCLAHDDSGAVVLVEGGIPGELVEVELRFRKKNIWFATVRDAIESSSDRREAPCPYVPECGGCQWQHITYSRQLELKLEIVRDALRRAKVSEPDVMSVHGMHDPWRYRWRGEFHVVPGEHGARDAGLGFNRARSWRPIAVDDCLIHHESLTSSLPLLRELVRTGGTDELRTLHLTAGEDGAELLVRERPRGTIDRDVVDRMAATATGRVRLSTDSTSLRWRGHSFRITPEAFMQVNWTQMDALYQSVLDGLGDVTGLHVVDAFAGVGVLAVELAMTAAQVVCMESNRAAARLGVLNAQLNDVAERVRFVAVPVERALPQLASETRIDRVLLDPPRAGCGGAVTAWLALAGPERVVYVSCDPATLARDLHVLVGSGPYVIETLSIVDMFPQTHHVESVTTMRRQDAPERSAIP